MQHIWTILAWLILPLYFFAASLLGYPAEIVSDQGRPLEHSNTSLFIHETFKENGIFSAEKSALFLKRLQQEREFIANDLYETRFLEKVHIDVKSQLKAHESGVENRDASCPILRGYDEYLIPLAQKIADKISSGYENEAEIQPLTDTFIRGYLPYFSPNAHRTRWNYDKDISPVIKNMFRAHHIKKNNPDIPEAINLTVPERDAGIISACLGRQVLVGEFLQPEDMPLLKKKGCSYDLSRADPGASPFWQEPAPGEKGLIGHEYDHEYPDEGTKVVFKRVRFKGNYSPKITAEYRKNGRFYKIKVKFGTEVHTEIALSLLGKYAGFNHDHMRYQPEIKIWLGDLSFEDFQARFAGKYGLKDLVRLIHSHGKDENGEEWFILKGAMYEFHPADELRVSSASPTSWDLPMRREFRGYLLWKAWLSIGDTKKENYKALFRSGPDGLKPLLRLQDTGYSLGPSFLLRKPRHILNLTDKYKVNEFEKSILKKSGDGSVLLYWNDFFRQKKNEQYAGWNDLRWMARKIASLSPEEIEQSLILSGMPDPVRMLYSLKLKLRRNEIVQAFELEDEFELFEVSDPDKLNVGESIKKGRLVQTSFEGKNDFVLTQQTWVTFLTSLLGSLLSQKAGRRAAGEEENASLEHRFTGAFGNNMEFEGRLIDNPKNHILDEYSLGTGINAVVFRSVGISPQLFSAPGRDGEMQGRPYMVTDTLSLSIGASSGFLEKLLSWLPVQLSASVELFKVEFQMIQFSETVKDGYLAPLKIFKVLKDPEKYALRKMEPLEIFKRQLIFGLSAGASLKMQLPAPRLPVLSSGGGAGMNWISSYPVSFLKDQFGSLHLVAEEGTSRGIGAGINLLDINLLAVRRSLFRLEGAVNRQSQSLTDLVLSPPDFSRDRAATAIGEYHFKKYYKIMKKLTRNPQDESLYAAHEHSGFIKKFEISGSHKTTIRDFHCAFIFDYFRQRSSDRLYIRLSDGDERFFIRKLVSKKKLVGVEKVAFDFGEKNILVPLGNSKRVWIEMDEKNPLNFVGIIDVVDYRRTMNRQDIYKLIGELNRRYSPEGGIFYRQRDLPEEVYAKKYKKIYANTRIMVDGGVLTSLILDQTYAEFKSKIKRICSPEWVKQNCGYSCSIAGIAGLKLKKRELKKKFQKLQKIMSYENPDRQQLAKHSLDFIYECYNSSLGTRILEQIMGTDGLLVTGEIYGIYRSFSDLQDLQQFTPLRYMATHWGQLNHLPPVQHYLRYEMVVMPTSLVTTALSQRDYLGSLYHGVPANFTGF